MSCEPLANAIFNKIEPKYFHVSRENAQEILTKLDNIQNGLAGVNNVETRVDELEQCMWRPQRSITLAGRKIEALDAKIESKMKEFEDKLDCKIKALDAKIEALDAKIESKMKEFDKGLDAKIVAKMEMLVVKIEAPVAKSEESGEKVLVPADEPVESQW